MWTMLCKVWSATGLKKAVVAEDLENLKIKGCAKLNINAAVTAYMEDGTEVDDDEVFQCLSPNSVVYLLTDTDEKPWEASVAVSSQASVSAAVETAAVRTQSCAANLRHETWPSPFLLCEEMFSLHLREALRSENFSLTWQLKSAVLNIIFSETTKYTDAPNPAQRDEVARSLCLLFPNLATRIPAAGGGSERVSHEGWAVRLYDRFREHRRQKGLKRAATQELASNGKRPLTQDTHASTEDQSASKAKVTRRRRGEVNWEPLPPDGEDSVSIAVHEEWLQKEARKLPSSWDDTAVNEKMLITFSNRRVFINSAPPLLDIKSKYPTLFTVDGLWKEFKRLMVIDLDERVLHPLLTLGPKMIQIAERRRNKMSESLANLYHKYSSLEEKSLTDQLIMAVLLLPFLLGESSSSFYELHPVEVAAEEVAEGPTTPHVAVIGCPFESSTVFVVGEGAALVEAAGFLQGLVSLVALYYCCNVQYPAACKAFFNFLEVALLKLEGKGHPLRKVMTLLEKLQ